MCCRYRVTPFDLLVLVSSLFTTVGGILSLYGTDKFGSCNNRIAQAAIAVQSVAVLLCLLAIVITGWNSRSEANPSKSPVQDRGPCLFILSKRTTNPGLIQAFVLTIVNIVSLVMVTLIWVQSGCNNFVYNAIYNIVGILGSFIITFLASLQPSENKNNSNGSTLSQPVNQVRDPHAGTLHQYMTRNLHIQRRQYPVSNRPHLSHTSIVIGRAG